MGTKINQEVELTFRLPEGQTSSDSRFATGIQKGTDGNNHRVQGVATQGEVELASMSKPSKPNEVSLGSANPVITKVAPSKTTLQILGAFLTRCAHSFSGVPYFFSRGESQSNVSQAKAGETLPLESSASPTEAGAPDLVAKAANYKKLAESEEKRGRNQFSFLFLRGYFRHGQAPTVGHSLTKEAIPFQKADCYLQLSKDCTAAAKAKEDRNEEKLKLFQKAIQLGEEAIGLFDNYEQKVKDANDVPAASSQNFHLGNVVLYTMGEALNTSKAASFDGNAIRHAYQATASEYGAEQTELLNQREELSKLGQLPTNQAKLLAATQHNAKLAEEFSKKAQLTDEKIRHAYQSQATLYQTAKQAALTLASSEDQKSRKALESLQQKIREIPQEDQVQVHTVERH